MAFSPQLRYAEVNLQVQVKLEFVMTSVGLRDVIEKQYVLERMLPLK